MSGLWAIGLMAVGIFAMAFGGSDDAEEVDMESDTGQEPEAELVSGSEDEAPPEPAPRTSSDPGAEADDDGEIAEEETEETVLTGTDGPDLFVVRDLPEATSDGELETLVTITDFNVDEDSLVIDLSGVEGDLSDAETELTLTENDGDTDVIFVMSVPGDDTPLTGKIVLQGITDLSPDDVSIAVNYDPDSDNYLSARLAS